MNTYRLTVRTHQSDGGTTTSEEIVKAVSRLEAYNLVAPGVGVRSYIDTIERIR